MDAMDPIDMPDARQRIYDYVERHGRVDPARARDALGYEPRRFGHHLSMLKRDGYLTERDGDLEIALDVGSDREVECDGIPVTIRPARQDDIAGIVGVIRQVADEGTYIEAESVAQQLDHEDSLLRHNEFESRVFFVATVEEEVVGWVHLEVPEMDKLGHNAELTVGIVEEYRGHGIGSRLLERGLEWAADADLVKVYNSFPASNEAAIDFFERQGGAVEAVREDHYRIDGDPVDEVMMAIEV
ncbi:MAG: N-acetyltransferase family protein [Halorientalis sp.]